MNRRQFFSGLLALGTGGTLMSSPTKSLAANGNRWDVIGRMIEILDCSCKEQLERMGTIIACHSPAIDIYEASDRLVFTVRFTVRDFTLTKRIQSRVDCKSSYFPKWRKYKVNLQDVISEAIFNSHNSVSV